MTSTSSTNSGIECISLKKYMMEYICGYLFCRDYPSKLQKSSDADRSQNSNLRKMAEHSSNGKAAAFIHHRVLAVTVSQDGRLVHGVFSVMSLSFATDFHVLECVMNFSSHSQ